MAYRYANFYAARPPIQERVLRAQYATLARNHTAAWLLGVVSCPSEPVVMGYLGRDSKIHVIHRVVEDVASLEYPSPRFEGNFIGLMDEVGDFGANLGAIDGEFFEELVMDSVPLAQAVAVALAATPSGHQLAVAADKEATRLTVQFGVMVPPPLVPELLRLLARGPVFPRALWALAQHIMDRPSLLASCSPFIDWCRVAVAMGVDEDNPLQSILGSPQPVAHNEALGRARAAVRDLAMAASVLQPIVDAMIALGNASRERNAAKEDLWYAEAQEKVAPSTIWESGIGSLWHICQVRDDAGLPAIWARLAKVGLKHGRRVLAAAASEPPNSPLYSLPTVGRPVISPELARSVVALQFCDGHNDLEGCLSIFAVLYPSQDSVTAANKQNGLYDQQANGATAPTRSDLLDGKKSRSLKLPMDWFQLRQVFGAYHRLLQILLGEDHDPKLVQGYGPLGPYLSE
jgi:hypothetical protein